jgi:hypothetical protein
MLSYWNIFEAFTADMSLKNNSQLNKPVARFYNNVKRILQAHIDKDNMLKQHL